MSCNPELVESKQVNNETVAYRIVCCGEACDSNCAPAAHCCEDTWHTICIHREDHDGYLEARKSEVAARHEKIKAWRKKQK